MSQFKILNLIRPSSVKDYDGYGTFLVRVIGGAYKGRDITVKGAFITCCPSFIISGTLKPDTQDTFKAYVPFEYKLENPNRIERRDALHFMAELHLGPDYLTLEALVPISTAEFKKHPLFSKHPFESTCDFFRLEMEIPLYVAFDRERVRKMKPDQLRRVHQMLMSGDIWRLWFYRYVDEFGLKEMSYAAYINFKQRYKPKINLPPFFTQVVRVYAYLKDQRAQGHEIFDLSTLCQDYFGDRKWGPKARNGGDKPVYMERVTEFLKQHALVEEEVGPETQVGKVTDLSTALQCPGTQMVARSFWCFPKDKRNNLELYHYLSHRLCDGHPRLRKGNQVPCLPSGALTDEQRRFVQHVRENQVSFLEGAPGTGKSETIVALLNEYESPMIVTFVGMMVDALQKRLGGRIGTVHTIHHVIYTAKSNSKWLKQFDIIIMDEGSNVDAKLLSEFLRVMPLVCRLVIVGDLGQIYPIKPGCPFADLTRAFPEHCFQLTQNKRAEAMVLVDAAKSIREGKGAIEFGGCLRLIESEDMEGTIKQLLLELGLGLPNPNPNPMDMQIVTLRNKDRKALNAVAEGVLHPKIPKDARRVNRETLLYPGQKIQFTKNTKPPACIVRNGELGLVQELVDSRTIIVSGKKVIIGEHEVKAKDIQPGYATTCNKAQGSEWKHIIFWIHADAYLKFSREYAYVAISRAKTSCTVICPSRAEFDKLCAQRALPRRTLLRYYLETMPIIIPLHPFEHVALKDPKDLVLLAKDIPAVPQPPEADNLKSKKAKK